MASVCLSPEENYEAVARGHGVERVQKVGVKAEEVLLARRLGNTIARGGCAHRQPVGETEEEGGVEATAGLGAEGNEAVAEVLAEDVAAGRLGDGGVPEEARDVQAREDVKAEVERDGQWPWLRCGGPVVVCANAGALLRRHRCCFQAPSASGLRPPGVVDLIYTQRRHMAMNEHIYRLCLSPI